MPEGQHSAECHIANNACVRWTRDLSKWGDGPSVVNIFEWNWQWVDGGWILWWCGGGSWPVWHNDSEWRSKRGMNEELLCSGEKKADASFYVPPLCSICSYTFPKYSPFCLPRFPSLWLTHITNTHTQHLRGFTFSKSYDTGSCRNQDKVQPSTVVQTPTSHPGSTHTSSSTIT